jgi:hypothetical protein
MVLEEQNPAVDQENTVHRLTTGLLRREALRSTRWEQRSVSYRSPLLIAVIWEESTFASSTESDIF